MGHWPLGLIVPLQDPTPFSPFSPTDWPQSLLRVAQGGYEAVELAVTDPQLIAPSEVETLLAQTGLRLAAVTTGQAAWKEGLSLSSPDERIRLEAIARIKAHVEVFGRFGAVIIVGLLRGKTGKRCLLKESLGECAHANPKVRLALEPLNRYETGLLNTVEEALGVIETVGAENVGILWDSFHANIEEPSLSGAIKLAGERLFHVHLADSNRWIPGFGHLPFNEIWEALERVGYSGSIVLECLPKPEPEHILSVKEVQERVGFGF